MVKKFLRTYGIIVTLTLLQVNPVFSVPPGDEQDNQVHMRMRLTRFRVPDLGIVKGVKWLYAGHKTVVQDPVNVLVGHFPLIGEHHEPILPEGSMCVRGAVVLPGRKSEFMSTMGTRYCGSIDFPPEGGCLYCELWLLRSAVVLRVEPSDVRVLVPGVVPVKGFDQSLVGNETFL